ncbi:MAG: patatin-like phospholipase family protein [Candidatus Promineifilaceae bacterium]
MNTFRIQSLDGGGIRGLLITILLRRLEEEVPGWIDQVDLIAGTSTGATIALGLAGSATPDELVRLYYNFGPDVFRDSRSNNYLKIRKIIRADYDAGNLAVILKRVLGEKRLGELRKKILVTTFDLDNDHGNVAQRCWGTKFFHNLAYENGDADLEAYKVALYSCATPVYFRSNDGYVDGAVTAQNPSLAALAYARDETLNATERPIFENIVLLSIGTGKAPRFVDGNKHDWGYAQWTRILVDMMLEGSVELVDKICRPLLGSRNHRLCPCLPHTIHADEWKKRDELVDLGEEVDLQETVEGLRQGWTVA